MPVFKAYDLRGKYGSEIDEAFAGRLGSAVVRFLGARRIAVGRDARLSAPSIAAALAEGAGCEVVDIGLCSTPQLYFAVGHLGLDGGVMVTASHNPPGDIGFKICRAQAAPVGESTGLKDIERLSAEPPAGKSRIGQVDLRSAYRAHLRRHLPVPPKLKIVVDAANGSVGPLFDAVFDDLPVEWVKLCFEPDGRFPNHEPDPTKDGNVRDLREAMRTSGAGLGAAFDGDGDRCMFFGPGGVRIPGDLMTVLLAQSELHRHPGAAIVYDLRSSRVVPEEIAKAGGVPVRERVGHSFIKETMRKRNAVLGGEISGHYYFRDHWFADSGLMAFTKLLDLLGREGRPIEDLVLPLRRTLHTGEINFRVKDKDAMLARLPGEFPGGRIDRLDGVTLSFDDCWFNVRPSNTEPLLRLNLEADGAGRLEEMKSRLFALLGTPL